MAALSHCFKKSLILFIRFYRYAISLLLGNCCRFEPTCSQYAINAIETHSLMRGIFLTVRRIGRCHPWQEGGMDPVPPRYKLNSPINRRS